MSVERRDREFAKLRLHIAKEECLTVAEAMEEAVSDEQMAQHVEEVNVELVEQGHPPLTDDKIAEVRTYNLMQAKTLRAAAKVFEEWMPRLSAQWEAQDEQAEC